MKQVIVYTTTVCPYCIKAKQLLKNKGVDFEEINLDGNPDERMKLVEKANGMRTVPQIFIGERHVGGCDDLYALEFNGELDALLELTV
ncbi:MAG: glutaredoxin 3 [Desulfuromonas sp.]|nr:MAG: glutaredoxin 3 [Desulfuromonas sp.]